MRHISAYICGVVCFTPFRLAGLPHEPRDQFGELQKIRDPNDRPTSADNDLRIGRDDVSPLRRHRADTILIDAQQEPHPVPVVPLADTDELSSAQRMERMRDPHKMCRCIRNTSILSRVISGSSAGGSRICFVKTARRCG